MPPIPVGDPQLHPPGSPGVAAVVCSWEGAVQHLAASAELEPVLCFH